MFLRISGRVQGVNYRNSAKRQADELGLIGWVRNTSEGTVELLVGGEGPEVEALITWCGTGPQRAEVTEVEARPATEAQLETLPEVGFQVRR